MNDGITGKLDPNDPEPNKDCVRVGDHIVMKGLYVHEHQHSIWEAENADSKEGRGGSRCIRPLSWKENGLMACWGHAELHPYDGTSIKKISQNVSENLNPDGSYTESHTVVAPIYKAYYSQTYLGNKLEDQLGRILLPLGNFDTYVPAGTLVDSQKYLSMNHNFFINAPPKPEECKNNNYCRLDVSVNISSSSPYNESNKPLNTPKTNFLMPIFDTTQKNGKITTAVDYERNGVNVNMFASALAVKNPLVLMGEFTLKWISASADESLRNL